MRILSDPGNLKPTFYYLKLTGLVNQISTIPFLYKNKVAPDSLQNTYPRPTQKSNQLQLFKSLFFLHRTNQ